VKSEKTPIPRDSAGKRRLCPRGHEFRDTGNSGGGGKGREGHVREYQFERKSARRSSLTGTTDHSFFSEGR